MTAIVLALLGVIAVIVLVRVAYELGAYDGWVGSEFYEGAPAGERYWTVFMTVTPTFHRWYWILEHELWRFRHRNDPPIEVGTPNDPEPDEFADEFDLEPICPICHEPFDLDNADTVTHQNLAYTVCAACYQKHTGWLGAGGDGDYAVV